MSTRGYAHELNSIVLAQRNACLKAFGCYVFILLIHKSHSRIG